MGSTGAQQDRECRTDGRARSDAEEVHHLGAVQIWTFCGPGVGLGDLADPVTQPIDLVRLHGVLPTVTRGDVDGGQVEQVREACVGVAHVAAHGRVGPDRPRPAIGLEPARQRHRAHDLIGERGRVAEPTQQPCRDARPDDLVGVEGDGAVAVQPAGGRFADVVQQCRHPQAGSGSRGLGGDLDGMGPGVFVVPAALSGAHQGEVVELGQVGGNGGVAHDGGQGAGGVSSAERPVEPGACGGGSVGHVRMGNRGGGGGGGVGVRHRPPGG